MFDLEALYLSAIGFMTALSPEMKIASGAVAFGCLLFLLFGKRDFRNPFWAVVALVFGVALFGAFILGGICVGRMFGFAQIGAFLGIFAFLGVAALYNYYKTPKEQRRRKF